MSGVGSALNIFIADTYVLLAKTQACHWNATGANFYAMHLLTEAQYTELFAAVDNLAERARALRQFAPGGLAAMLQLATLEEADCAVPTEQAARMLASDNTAMAEHARDLADEADDADDTATHDMLVARIAVHEKAAWLWRSHLA
ncbi:DNA starvation/stationary phase protection protein [Sediminicoccus sp. KRV36]|uniref:Dps family protein n=1 Tax=Sediminicoccus sp. KRV36 TaxID=3133721 RepID=UPI00200F58C1|nr:DNA starvation/stationary phase protection protein [Sediminicoccus rosea]UPY36190.1 DNA starvation/stationary phase protection protein [Sediminicoccus rosea]